MRIWAPISVFFPVFLFTLGVSANPPISEAVEKLLAAKHYPPASMGIVFKEQGADSLLVGINADSMLNPASVMKLLTAAVAYDRFGVTCSFGTDLFVDSVSVGDSGLTVRNLYIRGGGDPGFTAERMWLFVEHLHHCGIRKIRGNIVIDDFLFDSTVVGPGFEEDSSSSESYVPLISALAVNFNTIGVHLRPGPQAKTPVAVSLFPEIDGIRVATSAMTVAHAAKDALRIATEADGGGTLVRVQGSMSVGDPGLYAFKKLRQTWGSFGGALVPLLSKRGIEFDGRIIHGRVPSGLAAKAPFYEFSSDPLSLAVERMFKFSSNFTAEMLFKLLSARDGDTMPGSWERSAALVRTWWSGHSLPGMPVVANGSGMGDIDRISAGQLCSLLSFVWNQKAFLPDYLSALPNAGLDGTLRSRFKSPLLKGRIRAKTGTINSHGVCTLAGFYLPPNGKVYTFAILCNNTGHGQWEDWMMQEKILEKVAEMVGEEGKKAE